MSAFDAVLVGQRVILGEAEALRALSDDLGETFARAVETVFHAKGRVVCTGMGKSGHVARKIAATLASTGTSAMFVHPAEASHGDLGMIGPDDVVLALSKSGAGRELSDTLVYAKRFSIPLIAMTAVADSQLGLAADILLLLPDAPEATAEVSAPTTSTTLQIALGDALAVALLERRGFTASDFRVFHPGGKLGSMLRTVGDLMHGDQELPLVAADAPMPAALLVMSEKRFGAAGVIDASGQLIGLITDGDLRRHMDGLMSHIASEVMTRAPLTIGPTSLAAEALKIMNERRITVLFVVEDNRPVGILHVHDLLRAGII